MRKLFVPIALTAAFSLALLVGFAPARAAPPQTSQPTAAPQKVDAPRAFLDACQRHAWLCSNEWHGAEGLDPEGVARIARKINSRVNFLTAPIADIKNYGKTDYWTLPRRGLGDCEDFALEKYKRLLDAGVAGRDLSIAIVLDRKRQNHAVLVLHHSSGDLVLDNLSSRIKPRQRTGYRFLAMQSRTDKRAWHTVSDQPSAPGTFRQRRVLTGSSDPEWAQPGHD